MKSTVKLSEEIISILQDCGKSLGEGETDSSLPCPWCGGGRTHEKGFRLTKKGDSLLFICFRASCGESGCVGLGMPSLVPPEPDKEKAYPDYGRIYRSELKEILSGQYEMLRDSYGLAEKEINDAGWKWAPADSRLALPVRSPAGVHRGYQLRAMHKWQMMKWSSWQEKTSDPWLAWYRRPNPTFGGPLVLVEDMISALKVSRHFPCCALLGTNFSLKKVDEIARNKRLHGAVVLGLDRDAYGVSLNLLDKWKFYLEGNFFPICLSKDFKYEPDKTIIEQVRECLNGN